MATEKVQAVYDALMRRWEEHSPWYRRISARFGLQGKLIACFFALIIACCVLNCWMFARQSGQQLNELMGEQARQVCSTLALTSETRIRNNEWDELTQTAQQLIKSRNILFVGFLDTNSQARALASRDLDFRFQDLSISGGSTQSLMQVRPKYSPVFGDYLEVMAPVLTTPSLQAGAVPAGSRLIGYVAVGVSRTREFAQLQRINWMVAGVSFVVVLFSLPLALALVHRVFQPIRQLVDATRKITGGDLDTQVAIHRPDVIGTLARSFNDMVIWVKTQQHDLASVNKKLHEANLDLEAKVEQRTAQLETANKRLSAEIAEKEDFLRAVSHDLNAPLRNIAGMATVLLMKHREKFDQDIIHRLERIQKNVEIETDLIGELLELSRIKTRRQRLEPTEIEPMVRELRDVFENDLRSKGIELIIDTPLPNLVCEKARLRQVFQNLVDNAIKYMGSGAYKEIHIGCQVKLTEAEFYVRDTGIGIEKEDLDKIFFVFRRGKNSHAQNIAGKGVGLASVKSIIETYNGKIVVESEVGRGSTFRFTINARFVANNSAPRTAPHQALLV